MTDANRPPGFGAITSKAVVANYRNSIDDIQVSRITAGGAPIVSSV